MSQINHKFKEHSANLIYALTEGQLNIYNLLAQAAEDSATT